MRVVAAVVGHGSNFSNVDQEQAAGPDLARESLKLIITSGGTSVPIDAVRTISNDSAGTSAALIAQCALEHGHFIHYLCSKNARTPYEKELSINPAQPLETELSRISEDARRIVPLMQHSVIDKVATFDAYRARLLELSASPDYDAVIVAMAASDYGPRPASGKIGSDKSVITIELQALPKIISEIKKERANIFLVGFKLLINEPPDVLIERAYENLLRDKQNLAVANVGKNSMNPSELTTYIITAERGIIPVRREELAETLLRFIEYRHSRRFYATQLNAVDELPVPAQELAEFIADVKRLGQLALFAPYIAGARAEFGFVAKRVQSGTLITGRGSSKTDAGIGDLSVVTSVDLENLTLSVSSLGAKASLNASLAHLIMQVRPEVDYIVHAHIPLKEAARTARDSTPATAEDWEIIEPLVRKGHFIIEQPNHGVMILLQRLDDIFDVLARNGIYHAQAQHYDAAYNRFIDNTRILDFLCRDLPPNARILDLAAGSGEVTRKLLDRGYSNITLADISPQMLEVARQKVGHIIPDDKFVNTSFQELSFSEPFDAIVIRQAINYLPPHELAAGLEKIHDALKPGAKVVFNTFDPELMPHGGTRFHRIETPDKILLTHEGNLFEHGEILHGQRTEIFGSVNGDYHLIYDLNRFWSFTVAELTAAIDAAGFSEFSLSRVGNSLYFVCRR